MSTVLVIVAGMLACSSHSGERRASPAVLNTPFVPDKVPAVTTVKGPLTIPKALAFTLLQNPSLNTFSTQLRLTEISRLRAGLRPNPEISLEVEDILGAGARRWLGSAQATLGVSYLFELGGKRKGRLAVAAASLEAGKLEFGMKKRQILMGMMLQYAKNIYLEHEVDLFDKMHDLDTKIRSVFKLKVEGDMLSPLQLAKFDLAMGMRKHDRERNKIELSLARRGLAAYWGVNEVNFSRVDACFYMYKQIKPMERLRKSIGRHPGLVYFEALKKLRASQAELAKSGQVPDITVTAGVRYYQETKDAGGVIGVSVPIMVNGSGDTALREAHLKMRIDTASYKQRRFQIERDLVSNYLKLKRYESLAAAFSTKHIPRALHMFTKIEEGYRLGKLPYLEVLDAKKMIHEVHRKYHAVLYGYLRAYFIVAYLSGENPAARRASVTRHCL